MSNEDDDEIEVTGEPGDAVAGTEPDEGAGADPEVEDTKAVPEGDTKLVRGLKMSQLAGEDELNKLLSAIETQMDQYSSSEAVGGILVIVAGADGRYVEWAELDCTPAGVEISPAQRVGVDILMLSGLRTLLEKRRESIQEQLQDI